MGTEGCTQATTVALDAGTAGTLNADAAEFVPLGLQVDWAAMVFEPDYRYVPHMSDGDGELEGDAEASTVATRDGTRARAASGTEPGTIETQDGAGARGAELGIATQDSAGARGAGPGTIETQDGAGARGVEPRIETQDGVGARGADADSHEPNEAALGRDPESEGDGAFGAPGRAGGVAQEDSALGEDETAGGGTHGVEAAARGRDPVVEDFTPLREGAAPGVHVMLVALRQRADLNIRPGVILAPMTAQGRYAVRVFKRSGGTEGASVRACNLLYISPGRFRELTEGGGDSPCSFSSSDSDLSG